MNTDRQSKIDFIKGLLNGTRTIDEIHEPRFRVLESVRGFDRTVLGLPVPTGSDYHDERTKEFFSEEDVRDYKARHPFVQLIMVNWDEPGCPEKVNPTVNP